MLLNMVSHKCHNMFQQKSPEFYNIDVNLFLHVTEVLRRKNKYLDLFIGQYSDTSFWNPINELISNQSFSWGPRNPLFLHYLFRTFFSFVSSGNHNSQLSNWWRLTRRSWNTSINFVESFQRTTYRTGDTYRKSYTEFRDGRWEWTIRVSKGCQYHVIRNREIIFKYGLVLKISRSSQRDDFVFFPLYFKDWLI